MAQTNPFRLDKSVIEVFDLGKEPSDTAYWLTRPPEERFQAAEFLRQVFYGYDPAISRVQRVIEEFKLGER